MGSRIPVMGDFTWSAQSAEWAARRLAPGSFPHFPFKNETVFKAGISSGSVFMPLSHCPSRNFWDHLQTLATGLQLPAGTWAIAPLVDW